MFEELLTAQQQYKFTGTALALVHFGFGKNKCAVVNSHWMLKEGGSQFSLTFSLIKTKSINALVIQNCVTSTTVIFCVYSPPKSQFKKFEFHFLNSTFQHSIWRLYNLEMRLHVHFRHVRTTAGGKIISEWLCAVQSGCLASITLYKSHKVEKGSYMFSV